MDRKTQPGQKPNRHNDFAVAEIEMDQRTDVEGRNRAQRSKSDASKPPSATPLEPIDQPPKFHNEDGHERSVEDQRE
jgi:hypothetical protein